MLRIQVCPQKGIPLLSYSGDGIETINPTLGRGLDSWGRIGFIGPLYVGFYGVSSHPRETHLFSAIVYGLFHPVYHWFLGPSCVVLNSAGPMVVIVREV